MPSISDLQLFPLPEMTCSMEVDARLMGVFVVEPVRSGDGGTAVTRVLPLFFSALPNLEKPVRLFEGVSKPC